jgi:hypothetical protein
MDRSLDEADSFLTGMSALSAGLQALISELPRDTLLKV